MTSPYSQVLVLILFELLQLWRRPTRRASCVALGGPLPPPALAGRLDILAAFLSCGTAVAAVAADPGRLFVERAVVCDEDDHVVFNALTEDLPTTSGGSHRSDLDRDKKSDDVETRASGDIRWRESWFGNMRVVAEAEEAEDEGPTWSHKVIVGNKRKARTARTELLY